MRVETSSIGMARPNNRRTFCFYSYAGHALSSPMAFQKTSPLTPRFWQPFNMPAGLQAFQQIQLVACQCNYSVQHASTFQPQMHCYYNESMREIIIGSMRTPHVYDKIHPQWNIDNKSEERMNKEPLWPVRVVLVVAPSLRGTMTLSYSSPAKVLYTTW